VRTSQVHKAHGTADTRTGIWQAARQVWGRGLWGDKHRTQENSGTSVLQRQGQLPGLVGAQEFLNLNLTSCYKVAHGQ
jgi:hypothetical protein